MNITIAIPVFERTEYFVEALESAINQTVKCIILVVDNNSSHDKFRQIIAGYPSAQIQYVKNSVNLGMAGNWNKCIELCSTEFLSILHDDDILHPEFIECISKSPMGWDLLFTKSVVGEEVDQEFYNKLEGEVTDRLFTRISVNHFSFGNFNHAPGTVFKIDLVRRFGGFSMEYGYILDFHLWLLFCRNSNAKFLDLTLSFYRVSNNQGTNSLYKDMVLNTYRIMKLVPDYVDKPIIRYFSAFKIYCGGMDFFTKDLNCDSIISEFGDNEEFLRDHRRFRWIYDNKLLRKVILRLIAKFVSYNLQRSS